MPRGKKVTELHNQFRTLVRLTLDDLDTVPGGNQLDQFVRKQEARRQAVYRSPNSLKGKDN